MKPSKDLKELATKEGKGIFAIEVTGKHLGKADRLGTMSYIGNMDMNRCEELFRFTHLVYTGETPAEAFAMTWPGEAAKEVGL